ncbi:MAG TPA: ATP-binding protein [Chitinophagaceae bacterium]|nr:ATP-binding protein [Chitinophagaceae bacterium]
MNPTISGNGTITEEFSPTTKLFRPHSPTRLVIKKQTGQVAAVLAHEVRNPLTNINLSVELLGTSLLDHERKIYLDVIRRSVLRINNLINEVLKFQSTEDEEDEKHSVLQLLDEVLVLAEDGIMLKNISVLKLYDLEDCNFFMNKLKMKIALTNIIVNAIEAMSSENGELKLVTMSTETQYIIQIEDNGCGISQENLKRISTPYYTNKPTGLGLGLATTYDILRSNHVGIKVESEEGKGTRFNLILEKK